MGFKGVKIIQVCFRDVLMSPICFHGEIRKNEPAHDKTYKMACVPSEDSDQSGHPPSLIRVCCPHEEGLGP